MTRLGVCGVALVLALGASLGGCGDDDDGGGGSAGKAGSSGAGGSAGSGTGGGGGSSTGGTAGSASGGTAGSTTGGAAGSTGGSAGAGTGGAAGSSGSAETFCTSYEAKCGFGSQGHFATKEDCLDDFANKFNATRQACVEAELALADSTTSAHCVAASGEAPCD